VVPRAHHIAEREGLNFAERAIEIAAPKTPD